MWVLWGTIEVMIWRDGISAEAHRVGQSLCTLRRTSWKSSHAMSIIGSRKESIMPKRREGEWESETTVTTSNRLCWGRELEGDGVRWSYMLDGVCCVTHDIANPMSDRGDVAWRWSSHRLVSRQGIKSMAILSRGICRLCWSCNASQCWCKFWHWCIECCLCGSYWRRWLTKALWDCTYSIRSEDCLFSA